MQQFNEDLWYIDLLSLFFFVFLLTFSPFFRSFQEMMKRIFPDNDINGKIDKLVLKFCDTSVNCDSLKSLLDCMESVLNEGYNVWIAHIGNSITLTQRNNLDDRELKFASNK